MTPVTSLRGVTAAIALGLILVSPALVAADPPRAPYLDPALPVARRVDDLIGRMTLLEKVGQMTQVDVMRLMAPPSDPATDLRHRGALNAASMRLVLGEQAVGSVLSGAARGPVPGHPVQWAEMTNAIQRYAIEHHRLRIPILYGVDAVRGHNNVVGATMFPHNLGLGATFDPALVEAIAVRTAHAVRATGMAWTFAPDADLARDLRWGRYYEAFSEDPALATELVRASVRGLQQRDLRGAGVAATAKHFVGYSYPLTGHDRTAADVSPRTLWQDLLPTFEGAIAEGVATMMINSGSVNGLPAHASRYLLTDLLRGKLGFRGVIVTDWQDIEALHTKYDLARDPVDAVRLGILAGIDMSMVPFDSATFTRSLIRLVETGKVPRSRIDESVRRILTLKFELGLFERPYVDPKAAAAIDGADRPLAREAARKGMTLLRNQRGVLPLARSVRTVLVAGVAADRADEQLGGWAIGWMGAPAARDVPHAVTLLQGVRAVVPKARVIFARDVAATRQAAAEADVVIIALGETPYAEGRGDSETAELPADQVALLRALEATGKPVVGVLFSGRPLIIEPHLPALDGLLMAYLPGSEGGAAAAEILFGVAAPGGRLPMSWPRRIGDAPMTYRQLPGPHGGKSSEYDPLFPFGHGLGYTTLRYRALMVPARATSTSPIRISVEVVNTGKREADEVVLVYAAQPAAPILVPARRLAAFARVRLAPGASRRVELEVPWSRLGLVVGDVDAGGPRVVAPGRYRFHCGGLSATTTLR